MVDAAVPSLVPFFYNLFASPVISRSYTSPIEQTTSLTLTWQTLIHRDLRAVIVGSQVHQVHRDKPNRTHPCLRPKSPYMQWNVHTSFLHKRPTMNPQIHDASKQPNRNSHSLSSIITSSLDTQLWYPPNSTHAAAVSTSNHEAQLQKKHCSFLDRPPLACRARPIAGQGQPENRARIYCTQYQRKKEGFGSFSLAER